MSFDYALDSVWPYRMPWLDLLCCLVQFILVSPYIVSSYYYYYYYYSCCSLKCCRRLQLQITNVGFIDIANGPGSGTFSVEQVLANIDNGSLDWASSYLKVQSQHSSNSKHIRAKAQKPDIDLPSLALLLFRNLLYLINSCCQILHISLLPYRFWYIYHVQTSELCDGRSGGILLASIHLFMRLSVPSDK